MDLQQLTKKNQEFIHIATHTLIAAGKTDEEIKIILEEALPTILDNQKKGIPARNSLGAPTVWATSFVTEANETKTEKNTNPWLMWLDTSLLFIGVIGLLNGVLSFFNTASSNIGITSLLALGFGGGAVMYATYYFIYRHIGKEKSQRPSRLKVFAMMTLVIIAWLVLYLATAIFPTSLNPQLPALALIIVGGIFLLIRYYLQRKYNIMNSLTTPEQPKN